MMSFNTITEKDILYYAIYGLMERLSREEERIKIGNRIAEYHYNKYQMQYREIHERILEIEAQPATKNALSSDQR